MAGYVTAESLKEFRNATGREDVKTRGGVFPCVGMTTLDLQRYRLALKDLKNQDYVPAMLMILGCKDENNRRIFSDADQMWIVELGADITEPVVNKILELSGLGADDEDDIVKNLEPGVEDSD